MTAEDCQDFYFFFLINSALVVKPEQKQAVLGAQSERGQLLSAVADPSAERPVQKAGRAGRCHQAPNQSNQGGSCRGPGAAEEGSHGPRRVWPAATGGNTGVLLLRALRRGTGDTAWLLRAAEAGPYGVCGLPQPLRKVFSQRAVCEATAAFPDS